MAKERDATEGPDLPDRFDELVETYLGRLDEGSQAPDSGALKDAARRLLEDARRLGPSRGDASGSFFESLGQRIGEDMALVLEEELEGAPSDRLLERLADRESPSSRYRLLGEVARGGMGAILEVWDTDLRRRLAMKVALGGKRSKREESPRQGTKERETLVRFLEEAQISSQLEHPGILPVHEVGIDAEGRAFFTMQLVKGRNLREIFELARGEREGWSLTRALGVLLRVCEAMGYAHAKGVIHRDLKPSNVMVGRFGEVYVMDWGLARAIGRRDKHDLRWPTREDGDSREIETTRGDDRILGSDAPLLTRDGTVIGTPAYMPPEQARGDIEAMDRRSDVYSLGAVLYELLTGRVPHAEPGTALSGREVVERVVARRPPPVHELAPSVPVELQAVCEKAMARPMDERYVDTLAMGEDLRAYLEGRVVSAHEAGAWAEARKWVRRNRALAAALAVSLALLVAGLVGTGVLYGRSENQRRRAEAETAKVLRLSDVLRLSRLRAEADGLWPALPERIEAMEDWLERAGALVRKVPEHRATLASMRSRARAALPGEPAQGPELALEEEWQVEVLSELIEDLEGLEAELATPEEPLPRSGWSVRRRLEAARELERRFETGADAARAWESSLPRLRTAYPELDLEVQVGLLPLGQDPRSGLWEFAHLPSGAPAERGTDGRLRLTAETGIVLVLLGKGEFWMGAQAEDERGRNYDPEASPDEGPVHEVHLSPFFVSKYELTQGQWQRLTGATPSYYGPHGRWEPNWLASRQRSTTLSPVDGVDWRTARTWLRRAGLELPTEAQWEYAARGGTQSVWWTGDEVRSLAGAANLADAFAKSHGADEWLGNELWLDDGATVHRPVGGYRGNGFGLHDVCGNLWEWCLDGFEADFYRRSPLTDPVAPWEDAASWVTRGGSFRLAATYARSANRPGATPSYAGYTIGIRPVRALAPLD